MKKKQETKTLGEARTAKARVRTLLAAGGEAAAVGVVRRPDGFAVRVTLRHPPRADTLPAEVGGVPVEVRISPPAAAHSA